MHHGLWAWGPANHGEAWWGVQVHASCAVTCAGMMGLLGCSRLWWRCVVEPVSWSCLRNWHSRCQHRRRSHGRRSRRWLLLQAHPPLMLLHAVGQETPYNHLNTMVYSITLENNENTAAIKYVKQYRLRWTNCEPTREAFLFWWIGTCSVSFYLNRTGSTEHPSHDTTDHTAIRTSKRHTEPTGSPPTFLSHCERAHQLQNLETALK